jgi:ABC-type uncharacterized transport system auxiliary subunit
MRRLACILLAGCALTSGPKPPQEIRYFTPEHAGRVETARRPTATLRLRLDRISSADDLRLRILHRDSPIEVTPYETLRWTEEPEAFVRRALTRALFDDRPIEEVVSGAAPALEVEIVGFEEVTYRQSGRVELRYELHDDRTTIARGTIAIERRARSGQIEAVVEAIRAALDAATNELADRVETALRERASPAPDEGTTSARAGPEQPGGRRP